MCKKITLKNGLRIITVPQKGTETATVLVLTGTGSKYENKKNNGISHFLEHMLFKGTKKRPDKIEIAETLDRVGGIYNAFTGSEYTGYWAKVSAGHFDLALEWVSDIFLNSILPAQEVEKEKGVIIEEFNMYYDNSMDYVQILWDKLLYGDQPAGWNVLGTKENVKKMRQQEIFDYMKTQYTASNTVICVAGKIDESDAINKIKKSFSKINVSKPKKKPKVIDAKVTMSGKSLKMQTKPSCLIEYRKTDQTHFCLGVRTYNIFNPQRYSQSILRVILGGMMSSRLFIEVREKLGLAYYIRTDTDLNPDTGSLVTQAGVNNNSVEKAISVILKEYKNLANSKISYSELKKAKEYIKGKTAILLEQSDEIASFYATQEILEKKLLKPQEIYAKIDKVKEEDIRALSRDIFQPKNLNMSLIGPFKDKIKFQKILNKL
ncbi:MAG: pitrilysin family protein [Patescibacteria group bacterium]|nr:pitrilysin family protein [Patescibacteria group bacterium]